jgi:hypothetical protein
VSFWIAHLLCSGIWAVPNPAPATPGAPEVRSEEREAPFTGDRILLKSGRILSGARVVRQTSLHYVLEVVPGVDPLLIPLRQVVSLKRGAPIHLAAPPDPPPPPEEQADVLAATKISPDLIRRMATALSDSAITFENEDVVAVLRHVAKLSGVAITIGPELDQRPPDERRGTFNLSPGASFNTLIREQLKPALPWIVLDYRYNALHFSIAQPETTEDASTTLEQPQEEGPAN